MTNVTRLTKALEGAELREALQGVHMRRHPLAHPAQREEFSRPPTG